MIPDLLYNEGSIHSVYLKNYDPIPYFKKYMKYFSGFNQAWQIEGVLKKDLTSDGMYQLIIENESEPFYFHPFNLFCILFIPDKNYNPLPKVCIDCDDKLRASVPVSQ